MGDGDLGGIDRIQHRINGLVALEPSDLAELGEEVGRIMVEDNRKGVLEGKDRHDEAAPDLTYRNGMGVPTRARSSRSEAFGTTRGRYKGESDATFSGRMRGNVLLEKRRRSAWMDVEILPNNNLSTRTYQQLTGPRLAPRGDASRVITNYGPMEIQPRPDGLMVACAWGDVVDTKGRPFLRYHFDGEGQKRYDLRGVRRWGLDEVRKAVRKWARWVIGGR